MLTSHRYIWLYVLVLKSFLVYMSDIFTATTMLSSDGWTNQIYAKCGDHCAVDIQFDVAKWIFVGCIIFSFLLVSLFWHYVLIKNSIRYSSWRTRHTRRKRLLQVAISRTLSQTSWPIHTTVFVSLPPTQKYCEFNVVYPGSYDHFCFFCQIENSTKKKDDFAFFVFFTFKGKRGLDDRPMLTLNILGWKRLLLADGPRQSINALILYSFWQVNNQSWDPEDYLSTQDLLTSALFLTMMFTVLVFAGSVLLLIIAAFCYVPLLCYIQGNLKVSDAFSYLRNNWLIVLH